MNRSILIEVLDGTGKPSTVQKRVESYSQQLMSDPLPRPPQLLDLYGRSFPCSKPTCQQILHTQGWAEERFWLRSLHSWLLEHRRKPRSHAEHPVESRQATRLNVGYNYLQQQLFSETLVAALWRCFPSLCICLQLSRVVTPPVGFPCVSMSFAAQTMRFFSPSP